VAESKGGQEEEEPARQGGGQLESKATASAAEAKSSGPLPE